MIQAMFSGISGMKAFKSQLDVVGNNIANVNTIAYKAGRMTFKEMLSQTLDGGSAPSGAKGGSNPSQLGLGVMVGSIDTDQSQGSMTSTGRTTDLAIEGDGYFSLANGNSMLFTRDGSFKLDAQNNLVTATGLKVLGWAADPSTGAIDNAVPVTTSSNVNVPVQSMSLARQTSNVTLAGNLEASVAAGTNVEVTFSAYDSIGVAHEVNMTFTKSNTAAQWDYKVSCPDVGAAPVATGSLAFDSQGFSTTPSLPISLTFATPNGSGQPLVATINTQSISSAAQNHSSSTVDMSYNDGLALGTLSSFSIDRNGIVSGKFTNGSTRPLGQLALAAFNNPSGLYKSGSNLLVESPNSGSPKIGVPGDKGLGTLDAGFLEASNVNLANEFTGMIVAQRGFQANSKIITVSDEVLQDLVNLKR